MGRLDGRRVLVVGMGRSGIAAANLALREGAVVTTTDLRAEAPVVEGCTAIHGVHRREDFLGAGLIVVSPGVAASRPEIQGALAAGVEVVGELAFAASFLDIPIAAISGTNGKSSTTHFTGQLLSQAGFRPFVGGNLGTPLSLAVGGAFDCAVVEVSSYQMELPGTFHPKVAAILNLTPDHLGRHGTVEAYAAAKGRLFAQMHAGDVAILPAGDPLLAPLAFTTRAEVLWLGSSPGAFAGEEAIELDGTPDDGELSLEGFAPLGEHNRWNAAAAVLVALCLGARRAKLDLRALTPLAHRLETVFESGGVRWVDDSKATNVDAALVGIRGVGGRQVVLLGGQGKAGADYAPLRAALQEHARAVICFGQSGPEIAAALADLPVTLASDLREAVETARRVVQPGDVALLSPACASFDEFRDFEHRGEVYAAIVREGAL